jgi:hypothetical protein
MAVGEVAGGYRAIRPTDRRSERGCKNSPSQRGDAAVQVRVKSVRPDDARLDQWGQHRRPAVAARVTTQGVGKVPA